ncbi:MAG: T9SS type A sorting domain-containing protein [Saprospiraceae bacterium]|nr:T9SS type A sorting domain-containing protein [Saprospiraceae bacterium]
MKKFIYRFLFINIFLLTISLAMHGQFGCDCNSIPSQGNIVNVNTVNGLITALQNANISNGHVTIILAANTYQLTSNLPFIGSNMTRVTIKGATGNRDDVIIKGLGWNNNAVTHIFNVAADSFTVADMTIGEVFYHPIQVHSHPNDADHFTAHNVKFIDAKEQLLKVSAGGPQFADNGIVECCLFEFSAGIAFQYYTGGIDAHHSKDWIVRFNQFKGIRSPDGTLAEHAIHFWRESSGTVVEGNHIIDCDRGVGFGLGNDVLSGHQGGIIKNNFIHTSRDVGIGLEYAPNTKAYHNTIIGDSYPNAIEYRFAGTSNVHIANNLTEGNITSRDGGSGLIQSNIIISNSNIFSDANNYDYHLLDFTSGISDAGISIPEVTRDFDCQIRPLDSGYDIGADEFYDVSTNDVYLDDSGISIFPNPVENTFTITGLLSEYSVQVLNSQGQVYQNYNQNSGTIEIDISGLPTGLYFVKISNTNGS